MVRGARDFAELADYRRFVDDQVAAGNRAHAAATAREQTFLAPLPPRPGVSWSEDVGVVSSFSLIRVLKVAYMVPTRLNGHRLTIRIYDDRLEFYDVRQQVFTCPRLHGAGRTRSVTYHLIIGSLIAKPGAFARPAIAMPHPDPTAYDRLLPLPLATTAPPHHPAIPA